MNLNLFCMFFSVTTVYKHSSKTCIYFNYHQVKTMYLVIFLGQPETYMAFKLTVYYFGNLFKYLVLNIPSQRSLVVSDGACWSMGIVYEMDGDGDFCKPFLTSTQCMLGLALQLSSHPEVVHPGLQPLLFTPSPPPPVSRLHRGNIPVQLTASVPA